MPQTALALLALMIATFMSVSMQREVFGAQREMIANEMEVMASRTRSLPGSGASRSSMPSTAACPVPPWKTSIKWSPPK